MRTVSINIGTLCMPCCNRCRYCLLSYDGKVRGADWDRSCRYARGFYEWMKTNRPDLSFAFYFGHSMEHPRLLKAIDFLREMGSPTAEFLQMDGMQFRDDAALHSLLRELKAHGVKLLDFTFYGTRAYHDHFAARKGDYDYMLRTLKAACEAGLECEIGYPLTQESAPLAEKFLQEIEGYPLKNLFFFVPHGEGRGRALESIRLTEKDVEKLPEKVLSHFNRGRYKTEKDWLHAGFSVPDKRVLTLMLTEENIARYEKMEPAEVIRELEEMDDSYYRVMPSLPELAARYGDENGDKLYSERDLYLCYQRRFIQETGLVIHDMNDERQHFSRRF